MVSGTATPRKRKCVSPRQTPEKKIKREAPSTPDALFQNQDKLEQPSSPPRSPLLIFDGCPADVADNVAQPFDEEDAGELDGQIQPTTMSPSCLASDGAVSDHIGTGIPAIDDTLVTGPSSAVVAQNTVGTGASCEADLQGVLAAPARSAGCRTQKIGIAGLELSKSARSTCRVCKAWIGKAEYRFLFWHSKTRPAGYIHVECVIGVPLSPAQLMSDLEILAGEGAQPKRVLSEAWALLHAC